jgi:hypothetical protein
MRRERTVTVALIAPEPKQLREPVTLRLDAVVLQQLAHYAAHLDSSQEYVVNELLRTAFARDKAFQIWRRQHAADARHDASAAEPGTTTSSRRPRRLDGRTRRRRAHTATEPASAIDAIK